MQTKAASGDRSPIEQDRIEQLARREHASPALLSQYIAEGRVVAVGSKRRGGPSLAIGKGMTVKVNANLGTSPDKDDVKYELLKLRTAVDAGADTVMDLSVGGDVDEVRAAVLAESPVPVGTVPVYQCALAARKGGRSFVEVTAEEMLTGLKRHLQDGVDFVTVHCGINRQSLESLERTSRVCGVVSRGGSMCVEWMRCNRKENPLYEEYDEVLAMCREYGVVLSLGDGFRPGALADATDPAQLRELAVIGELVQRARAAGVQAIVEGPGHVPLDQIEANVRLEKAVCSEAPFYVLGPLVTDVGCGYDHITGAIGGALAAWYGADFLCYVTPSEHLGLPTVEDVRQGVVASKIAAHAADVARHHPGAQERDLAVSRARAALDWEGMVRGCVDPERAGAVLAAGKSKTEGACTMCGEFCAIRRMQTGRSADSAGPAVRNRES